MCSTDRARWGSTAVIAALLALGITACGNGSAPSADGDATSSSIAASTPTPAPVDSAPRDPAPDSTTATPGGDGEPVVIAFAGDIHFEGGLGQLLRTNPARIFEGVKLVFDASDVVVANLETAITERGTAAPKQFTFRSPPSALTALADAGVDVIGIANNHAIDFGQVGLDDTLAAAAGSPVPVIGVGRTEDEALEPAIVEAKGQRVAVLNATDVLDGNLITAWTATETKPGVASAKRTDQLLAAVRATRQQADTVVVFLHWGVEKSTCPSGRQQELARALVDAGADVVVGSHAHRVQAGGFLGKAAIGYGLGNFVFNANSAAGRTAGILRVTVAGRDVSKVEWVPARIDGVGTPTVLLGAEADAARDAWLGLRPCAGLADAPA